MPLYSDAGEGDNGEGDTLYIGQKKEGVLASWLAHPLVLYGEEMNYFFSSIAA